MTGCRLPRSTSTSATGRAPMAEACSTSTRPPARTRWPSPRPTRPAITPPPRGGSSSAPRRSPRHRPTAPSPAAERPDRPTGRGCWMVSSLSWDRLDNGDTRLKKLVLEGLTGKETVRLAVHREAQGLPQVGHAHDQEARPQAHPHEVRQGHGAQAEGGAQPHRHAQGLTSRGRSPTRRSSTRTRARRPAVARRVPRRRSPADRSGLEECAACPSPARGRGPQGHLQRGREPVVQALGRSASPGAGRSRGWRRRRA